MRPRRGGVARRTSIPALWEIDEAHERNYGRHLGPLHEDYEYHDDLDRMLRERERRARRRGPIGLALHYAAEGEPVTLRVSGTFHIPMWDLRDALQSYMEAGVPVQVSCRSPKHPFALGGDGMITDIGRNHVTLSRPDSSTHVPLAHITRAWPRLHETDDRQLSEWRRAW